MVSKKKKTIIKKEKKHEILSDTNASLFETNEEQMCSILDPLKHYC